MKRLVVARAARADLRAIDRYTQEQWGVAQKRRYLVAIRERFRALMRRPELGPIRDDLRGAYRSLPCGRHVIFYRVEGAAVIVVRVLHERMDMARHLPGINTRVVRRNRPPQDSD